jgi:hypothetical protein
LTDLYSTSLTRITKLEEYNEQIGQRMQERDEDLASAYATADRLEKTNLTHWIVHIVMGSLIITVFFAFALVKCR